MNDLILSDYGMTEKSGIAMVSSRIVAEKFRKDHRHVLGVIRKATEPGNGLSEGFKLLNFKESLYKDSTGRKLSEYLLTRDGFSYVAMGFTGKKAAQFKEAYINAFNQMETFIKNLLEAKSDFPEFTDAIMATREEPKHYHFSNELDMINRIVVGQSAKQFREANGIKPGKSIRPYLSANQVEAVKMLQRIDIGLIFAIPEFQKRKVVLEEQFARIGQQRLCGVI